MIRRAQGAKPSCPKTQTNSRLARRAVLIASCPKYKRTQDRRAGPSPSFIYHYDGERNHQGLGNVFVFLDTTALAMLCRSVLSSAEYHNRKETEIGTVSLKKGELVDFEAHLVGRSRNAAKPRVKRGRKSTLTADRNGEAPWVRQARIE